MLDRPSKTTNSMPNWIREKKVIHYHRGAGNNLKKYRPWEKELRDTNFFDRF